MGRIWLKVLVDRDYTDLAIEVSERFAPDQLSSQLVDPQVLFKVKQTKPTTVNDAIRATLEMDPNQAKILLTRPSMQSLPELTDNVDIVVLK